MANEIRATAPSGQTLYAILRNSQGYPYYLAGNTFEVYNAGHYASYVLALGEQGATGYYVGTLPASFGPAGRYTLTLYHQAGGSPAAGDAALGANDLEWTGTAEVFVAPTAGGVWPAQVSGYASGQDPVTLLRAATLALNPAVGTWDEAMTYMRAAAGGLKVEQTAHNTLAVYGHDQSTVLFTITYTPNIVAPTAARPDR